MRTGTTARGPTPTTRRWRAVFDELADRERVDPASLSARFAREYAAEPWRGYGGGAHRLFERIAAGVDWELAAHELFDASGSYGNGAAMRVAPLGAYFADADDALLVEQARASALPTHTHRDGVAGAIAMAVATAMAWRDRDEPDDERARARMFDAVMSALPECDVRERVGRASRMPAESHPKTASARLGNGRDITALDTVPFCLWSIGAHRRDLERAMWRTVSVMGDRDTTCAIVAGTLAMCAPSETVPDVWLERVEPILSEGSETTP